jgi:hypothetical protein
MTKLRSLSEKKWQMCLVVPSANIEQNMVAVLARASPSELTTGKHGLRADLQKIQ